MSVKFFQIQPSPYCRSVSLVAKLINLSLETQVVNLLGGEHLKPDYIKINPFKKVPAIEDDGFYLSESRAIICYLVDKYAPDHALYPKDLAARATINQMLFFDSGTLEPAMIGLTRPLRSNIIPGPEAHEKAKNAIKSLDTILSKRKYVASDNMTVADITIRATLTHNEVFGSVDLNNFKNVLAWSQKIREETSPYYEEINDQPQSVWKNNMDSLLAKVKSSEK